MYGHAILDDSRGIELSSTPMNKKSDANAEVYATTSNMPSSRRYTMAIFLVTTATFALCAFIRFGGNDKLAFNDDGGRNDFDTNLHFIRTLDTNFNNETTEILCQNEYSSIADLSYTYYLETMDGINVLTTIKALENLILHDLSDSLLFCNIQNRRMLKQDSRRVQSGLGYVHNGRRDSSILDEITEDMSLHIIGLSSTPDDVPSTKSMFKVYFQYHFFEH
jgi:hypothetical protein